MAEGEEQTWLLTQAVVVMDDLNKPPHFVNMDEMNKPPHFVNMDEMNKP